MFQIYLPIAEMSVDIFLLLGMGGAVGFLSGLFGVGGGFLMTPLLIFIGVPPPVAVGSEVNQVVAASVSGFMAHWRRRQVDFKMGTVLLAGGVLGSVFGVWLFGILRQLGQIDLVISISYVVMLGAIGSLMMVESVRTIMRRRGGTTVRRKAIFITGVTACPSRCVSAPRGSTSAPSCRSCLASSSAYSPPSWAWAAVSSWFRP